VRKSRRQRRKCSQHGQKKSPQVALLKRGAVLRFLMLKTLKSAPPPPKTAAEVLSTLPRPPELLQAQSDLESARSRREDLRHQLASLAHENSKTADAYREREMLRVQGDMQDVQDEIVVLRRRRAELRQPLAAECRAALAPLVDQACERIIGSVAAIELALETLREAALTTAPLAAGDGASPLPYGIEALSTLDLRSLKPLEYFARRARGEAVL
jgi:hypothetical protein